MHVLMIFITNVQAEPLPVTHRGGLFLSTQAVESSMGFQRYHHGFGTSLQRCTPKSQSKWTEHQPMNSCWQTSFRTGVNAEPIPSTNDGWFSTNMVTGSLMLEVMRGFTLGSKRPQLGFFAGPGLDVYVGGTEAIVATVSPSLVTEIEVLIPLDNHDAHLLWLSGGHRIWLHRATPMMSIGWGTQW